MSEVNIGKKIQEYRKAKNLTIRELAEMTGVTSSLLSQLERNLANPSINTLKTVAKALDAPLFSFFMNQGLSDSLIVRADNRKKLSFPKNKDFSYELLTPDTSGAIEFLLMTLSSHSQSSDAILGHEGEEVAYVIRGKVHLFIEDDVIVLNQGDSIRIPPFSKHKWENPTDDLTEVIFAVTPPNF